MSTAKGRRPPVALLGIWVLTRLENDVSLFLSLLAILVIGIKVRGGTTCAHHWGAALWRGGSNGVRSRACAAARTSAPTSLTHPAQTITTSARKSKLCIARAESGIRMHSRGDVAIGALQVGRDEERGLAPGPSRTRPGSLAGSAPPPSCTLLRSRRHSSMCQTAWLS